MRSHLPVCHLLFLLVSNAAVISTGSGTGADYWALLSQISFFIFSSLRLSFSWFHISEYIMPNPFNQIMTIFIWCYMIIGQVSLLSILHLLTLQQICFFLQNVYDCCCLCSSILPLYFSYCCECQVIRTIGIQHICKLTKNHSLLQFYRCSHRHKMCDDFVVNHKRSQCVDVYRSFEKVECRRKASDAELGVEWWRRSGFRPQAIHSQRNSCWQTAGQNFNKLISLLLFLTSTKPIEWESNT